MIHGQFTVLEPNCLSVCSMSLLCTIVYLDCLSSSLESMMDIATR